MIRMLDGLDAAVVGLAKLPDRPSPVLVYDIHQCALVMMGDGMDYAEALEFLEFNTIDADAGPGGPVFLSACSADEARALLGGDAP